jgi:hypothetical protein
MMFESRGDFAHPEIRHASTGLEVAGETERFLPPHRPMGTQRIGPPCRGVLSPLLVSGSAA